MNGETLEGIMRRDVRAMLREGLAPGEIERRYLTYRPSTEDLALFRRVLSDLRGDETRAAAFACYLLAFRALGAIYAERQRMTDAVCDGRIPRGDVPVWYPAELKWRDATNRAALLWRLFLILACEGR